MSDECVVWVDIIRLYALSGLLVGGYFCERF